LFTQPQLVEDLFAYANEPMADYFSYSRHRESCRYFFSNGKQLIAPADKQELAKVMHQVLGEKEEAVLHYLQQSEQTYEHIGKLFLQQSLHRLQQFKWGQVAQALRHARPALLFSSLHQYNQANFQSAEAVQLFNRYATYNGSNPYSAPAMLSLIPHLEMGEGTFYPKGGMISITNALHQLAVKKGVQFHFNTGVNSIEHQQGKVTGVMVNNTMVPADVVVSNGDAYFTYLHLLKDAPRANKILKQERSSSALIFYWGIGRPFEQLGLHNIFFTRQYQQEFAHLFSTKTFYEDPTVYINITSKMEAGQAPAGKENWFVMINAPAHEGQPWQQWIPEARQRILQKLSARLGTDVEALIETEAVLDPPTIESRTSSYSGSLYGTSSNSRMAAFLRHPNFSKRIKGLYFVGGSVHPGGGIPLCLQSAHITAGLVAADYKLSSL
jgi:phytoene desaturase